MKHDIVPEVEEYTKKHQQRKHWYEVVALLACVVMLCTLYALVLPAVTMGQDTCDLPEHTHSETCYDEDGTLICELDEHTHSDACQSESSDASEHTHDETCYDDNGMLICDLQESQNDRPDPTEESVHTSDEPSGDENETQLADSDEPQDNQTDDSANHAIQPVDEGVAHGEGGEIGEKGTMTIQLLYNEGTDFDENHGYFEKDDYYIVYPSVDVAYQIKLDPQNMNETATDMQVVVTMPKEYLDKCAIPQFGTDKCEVKSITREETDTDYICTIDFSRYDASASIAFRGQFSFKDNITPVTYKLPITAKVIMNGQEVASDGPLYYGPKYYDMDVVKFIFTHDNLGFQRDGHKVTVMPARDENDEIIYDDTENNTVHTGDDTIYVPFQFAVYHKDWYGASYQTENRRDVDTITLTDTLPEYQDKDGVTRYAEFDPAMNPSWEYDEATHTISKTYTGGSACSGNNSDNVLNKILKDKIYLKFPNLPLNRDGTKNYFTHELTNRIDATAIPVGKAEDEEVLTANDSLKFILTTETWREGDFFKSSSGDRDDTLADKKADYPWTITLRNSQMNPLQHIVIEDCEIDGDTGYGLDENLKFTRLESWMDGSKLPQGQTYADIIQEIIAYYDGGTERSFSVQTEQLNAEGNFCIYFNDSENAENPCNGYKIIFKDDYEMEYKGQVQFKAYTVFRDPENMHDITYRFTNVARESDYYYDAFGNKIPNYKTVGDGFTLKPIFEELKLEKNTHFNQDGGKSIYPGNTFPFRIQIFGTLLQDKFETKEYGKLYVIDLLPPGLSFYRIGKNAVTEKLFGVEDADKYKPTIIQNYRNSGRTALIFETTAEKLADTWGKLRNGHLEFIFDVQIDLDARPGTFENHVYMVCEGVDDPGEHVRRTQDIYDLDNDGSTDDFVLYSESPYTVVNASVSAAEKFIAPEGTTLDDSDSWRTNILNIIQGGNFEYRLSIRNEVGEQHTGVVVYDALPRIDDLGPLEAPAPRNSEFGVHLREPITDIPEGYTVYYTTVEEAHIKNMKEMVQADIWSQEVDDCAAVTAFKIVANEGTVLSNDRPFNARISVRADSPLSADSWAKLYAKEESYLEATNNFAYTTNEAQQAKVSNSVRVRIPFGEFYLRKVDDRTQNPISGAKFTLTDAEGTVLQTAVSDKDSLIHFKDLTDGEYILTETEVPAGYYNNPISLKVTVKQNPQTAEYSITFDGGYSNSGTEADPLVIENHASYELPATGGIGTAWHKMAGLLLILAALSGALYCRIKRKTADCTNC